MKIIFKILHYIKVKLIKKFYLNSKADYETKFNLIYKTNYWSDKESVSGSGSNKTQTQNAIKNINKILVDYNIKSIFDAPCGDFNWMNDLLKESTRLNKKNIQYLGADIVQDLILNLKKEHSTQNINFIKFDVISQNFPNQELFICRDCFIHFSNKDIKKTISNFLDSKIKYILITDSIVDDDFENYEIKTGEYRKLDLTKEPFNFPKNHLFQFNDLYNIKKQKYDTKMTLWSREKLNNYFLKKL